MNESESNTPQTGPNPEEPTVKPVNLRRRFLKRLLLGGVAACIPASAYAYLFEPEQVPAWLYY